MKNEDEKARIDNEYSKMSGTQKEFYAYGYMENMNNPAIDEKRLHEQLTDRISDISEIFEIDDITATVYGNGIRFGLDFDGYKVKFEGGIVAYRDVTIMGSGAYTYLYDVKGVAKIYNGDNLIHTYEYYETDFEAEFIFDEMRYYGLKETDF